MPMVNIRNLSKYGVITDMSPFDIPAEAWSFAVNARFRNNKITHGPVWRNIRPLTFTDPRFVTSVLSNSGSDTTYIGYKSGQVAKVTPTAETPYSIAGYADTPSDAVWTSTRLADVFYINRSDRAPWYVRASDSQFQTLVSGSGWDATWSAKLLRTCGGALVGLNVTKGATNYPTMIKTSSIPLSGLVPSSWDQTQPSTNATENIIAEMEGPIVDGATLRNDLIIYGYNETWLMRPVGGIDMFDTTRLFLNRGAINANCSIEVNGKHFVFGVDDIWMHDGVTDSDSSICEGTTRDFIYASIKTSFINRCFISHNPQLKELSFCYVSGDRGVAFADAPDGCNRAAVYNYHTKTWTFDDLPLVYASARGNMTTELTYATITTTYANTDGSYASLEDGIKRVLVYVGDVNTQYSLTNSLYAFDPYGASSAVSFAVDTNATKGLILERDGIDLDEMNSELRGYKMISAIYPQIYLDPDASPLSFTVGSSDFYGVPAVLGDPQTYDGNTLYKLDYHDDAAGRWLSIHLTTPDYRTIEISGFDLDLDVTGQT